MENKIITVSKDIEDFDIKLNNHINQLHNMRDSIMSEIVNKSTKLESCMNQNNMENRKATDLSSTLSKLKSDIITHNNKIKSLKLLESSIHIDESKITTLKNELDGLEESKLKLTTQLDMIKTEIRQSNLALEDIKYKIDKKNEEVNTLFQSKNKLNSLIAEHTNKSSVIEKRLKYLSNEEVMQDKKLLDIRNNIETSKKEYSSYSDNIIIIKEDIDHRNVKRENLLEEIKFIKTKIKELNEVKDNISNQIDSERKKNRSEENRLLALKKEVLSFILENKDIGNKKQIAIFAKEVENA